MPKFWIFGRTKDIPVSKLKSHFKNSNMGEKEENNESDLEDKICDEIPKEEAVTTSNVQNCRTVSFDLDNNNDLFYAVSLPSSCESATKAFVYSNKANALNIVKTNKGARFKTCKTLKEAESFAMNPPEDADFGAISTSESSSASAEHAPTRSMITAFRTAIEEGNADSFKFLLLLTLKHLVTGVDTPTIYKEGYRYNALHIAARVKQPEMCKLILETIEDPKFMERLYPDNSDAIREQRRFYLLDMYLNMPDKRLNETPLHFASKFGCLESVRVLASHPLCDFQRRNKYNLTPKDIICERCPNSEQLKKEIEKCFEEKYYVPVLRTEDNSIQPVVGEPYSPKRPPYLTPGNSFATPPEPKLTVMACAGPMSPSEARQFYKMWKTPHSKLTPVQKRELHRIQLSDIDKGLERIGRKLARETNTKWTEYWPSFGKWLDFSSPDGLSFLEKHLRKMNTELLSERSPNSAVSFEENNCNSPLNDSQTKDETLSHTVSPISAEIYKFWNSLQNFHITNGDEDNVHSVTSSHRNNRSVPLEPKGNSVSHQLDNSPVRATNSKLRPRKLRLDNGDKACDVVSGQCKKKILDVMTSIFHFDSFLNAEAKIHSLLSDEVLPEIRCLKNHNDISLLVKQIYDAIESNFQNHEKIIILRYLKAYLNYSSISISSDDEGDSEQFTYDKSSWQLLRHMLLLLCHHLEDDIDRTAISSQGTEKKIDVIAPTNHKICNIIVENSKVKDEMKQICDQSDRKSITEENNDIESKMCDFNTDLVHNHLENYSNSITEVVLTATKLTFSDSDDESTSSSNSDKYITPPDSPCYNSFSSDDDYSAPPEDEEVYVEGNNPSKVDTDIYHALENMYIDPCLYPSVTRWRHLISSKDERIVESWPSPAVQRYRQHIGSTNCTSPSI